MNLVRVDELSSFEQESLKLYCPIRDEMSLLPFFLEYHRRIGIKLFVFVDNGSVDGTLEYLISQEDCIVYSTTDSYAEANFAADWINELMQRHSPLQWAIYLDCDELLVYEGCESVSLNAFLADFDPGSFDSFAAILLDVYSAEQDGEIDFSTIEDFFKKVFYVDSDYVMRKHPKKPWARGGRSVEIVGGPRCRLFSTVDSDAKRGWFSYFIAGQVDRFIQLVPLACMPLFARFWPRTTFAQHKRPINFIGANFQYNDSHGTSNSQIAPYQLGVLHLKFSKELQQKNDPEFSFKNHYQRGLARFRLSGILRRRKNKTFLCNCSVRYEGSQTLLKYAMIGKEPSEVWLGDTDYFRTSDRR